MLSREQRTPLSEWWWTVDRLQLAAIIALMLAGIILSLAASPPVATRIGLDPFHFFNRHVLFLLPSFIVLIGVSFMSPRQIRRTALIVFAVSIVLILATLLIGPEVKGSRRWITLIGVNIQASESAKPAFVVLAAWLFAESARRPEMPATSMALTLLMTLVSLLVLEPDFGQTMLISLVWCALFFRDPVRVTPVREGIVVAPADGRVSMVAQVVPPAELGLGDKPLPRISIFMSVFNCHVNRSPVTGRIDRIAYRPGVFINAELDKASEDNERNSLVISMPNNGRIGVVQIGGLVARRIVSFVREGQQIGAGERFGLIRFGSRLDVYLPEGMKSLVSEGQTAIAGETILADFGSSEQGRTFRAD